MTSSTLLTRGTMLVDDEMRELASQVVTAAGDDRITRLTLTTQTGNEIELPTRVVDLLTQVLRRVSLGGAMNVQTMPEMLSTSAAAELLGVSRPTVMKMIHAGVLEPVMAGTHHRLRLADVMSVRNQREQARRVAVEELLLLGEDED